MHAQLWLLALVLAIWGHLTLTGAKLLDQADVKALRKLLASLKSEERMGAIEASLALRDVYFFFLNYAYDPYLRTLNNRREYIRMINQYTRIAGRQPIECEEAFGMMNNLHTNYLSLARLMEYYAMLKALSCPEQYRDWERSHHDDDDNSIQVNHQPAAVELSEEEIKRQHEGLSHIQRLFIDLKRSDFEDDDESLILLTKIITRLEDANMYLNGKLIDNCKMVATESREIFNRCRLECSGKSNGCFDDCVSGQKKPEMEKCLPGYDRPNRSNSEDESDSESDSDSDSGEEE